MSITHRNDPSESASNDWDTLYVTLVPLPTALVFAVLVSDTLFWLTGTALFSQASVWLLGAALTSGLVAAADGLMRYVSVGCLRPSKTCLLHVVSNLLALSLSLSNLIYRLNEDPARSVVPAGICLTAAVLLLLIGAARLGRGIANGVPHDDLDDPELI